MKYVLVSIILSVTVSSSITSSQLFVTSNKVNKKVNQSTISHTAILSTTKQPYISLCLSLSVCLSHTHTHILIIVFHNVPVAACSRAHLNDLENIPIFLLTGVIFVLSDPDLVFALMLFRLYTLARIIHTIVYAVYVIRQPTRAIAFLVGVIINVIMIICIFISFHQV